MATATLEPTTELTGDDAQAPVIDTTLPLRIGSEFPAVGISLALHMLVVILLAFVPLAIKSNKSSELIASLDKTPV